MASDKTIPPELIKRLNGGDSAAFEEIYRRVGGRIYNFIRSTMGDRYLAEELVQELFIKVWEKREEIDPDQNFDSYLFTIARHMVFRSTEQILAERHRICPLDETIKASAPSPEQELDVLMLKQHIDRVVNELPRMCRTVYRMSRHDHLSRKEIASRLSISERTVDSHLYLALQTLKSKLGNQILLLALLHSFRFL